MYVHNCAYIYTYRQTYIHRRDRESALFSLLSLHLLEPGCVGKVFCRKSKGMGQAAGMDNVKLTAEAKKAKHD